MHATAQYKAMADAAAGGLGGDLEYLRGKCMYPHKSGGGEVGGMGIMRNAG